VTISLGVASLSEGSETVDELLKRADERVYFSKHRGRNQVCSSDAADEDRRRA